MKTATLVIGALLIGGGLYLYSQHEAAKQLEPSLEAKANAALATETNPYTLQALAVACDKAGLHDLAALLQAKAQAILAAQKPMTASVHPAASVTMMASGTPASSGTLSLAQAVLSGGIHAPRYIVSDPGPMGSAPPPL